MARYFDEMKRTMEWLGQQSDTIFLGQSVGCAGTFMYGTVADVDATKRIELPVTEQLQTQMTLGLSLSGLFPISIFPRQNFLLLGLGDIINMIDKMPVLSDEKVIPPMIIRAAAGTTKPIFPGHQHVGNCAEGLAKLLTRVEVVELNEADEILPTYQRVYRERKPTIIIEFGDHYNDK